MRIDGVKEAEYKGSGSGVEGHKRKGSGWYLQKREHLEF